MITTIRYVRQRNESGGINNNLDQPHGSLVIYQANRLSTERYSSSIPRGLPRGLRCGCAEARLLGMRVRVPPEALMSLSLSRMSVVYCHVDVSAYS